MTDFTVECAAGSLRPSDPSEATHFDHRWSADGVAVTAPFTGAHLLHVAVAGCVLNDVYREAEKLGVSVHGVRVRATGGFDQQWSSTGIEYSVAVDSPAEPGELARLLAVVDEVAEIPRAVRAGAEVYRHD